QLDYRWETRGGDAIRSRREFVGRALRRPGPGHQLVETRGRPEIDQLRERVGGVGVRIDAVQFASFHAGSDASPVLRLMVVTGAERILKIERNRTHAPRDNIGIELNATVIQKARKAVPMVESIANGFSNVGLP